MPPSKARVVTSRSAGPDLADLRGPFLVGLLGGDEASVEALVERSRGRGADTALIVRDLLSPALGEIGRMWSRGEASVAEEHLATALASRVLARTSGRSSAAGAPRRRIVFACLAGEFHELAVRLLADVARECGWDAESLGANVPRGALVAFVAQRPPDALALSIGLAGHVPEAARTVEEVRAAAPGVTVLVGGFAVCEEPERVALTGADAGICDAVALREWLAAHAKAPRRKGPSARTGSAASRHGLPAEMPAALKARCRRPR